MFYSYVLHEGENYKVLINGGICVKIIAKTTIHKMGLKVEPHSQSYNVTWVNKMAQAIAQCCQLPYPHV